MVQYQCVRDPDGVQRNEVGCEDRVQGSTGSLCRSDAEARLFFESEEMLVEEERWNLHDDTDQPARDNHRPMDTPALQESVTMETHMEQPADRLDRVRIANNRAYRCVAVGTPRTERLTVKSIVEQTVDGRDQNEQRVDHHGGDRVESEKIGDGSAWPMENDGKNEEQCKDRTDSHGDDGEGEVERIEETRGHVGRSALRIC